MSVQKPAQMNQPDIAATTQLRLDLLTYLTPPKYLKIIWLLITINLILIASLGALMVIMSTETSHFVLSVGMTLSTVLLVLISGITTWRLIGIHEQHKSIVQGLNKLDSGVIITDATGNTLYCNRYIYKLWKKLPTNWITFLSKEIIHEASQQVMKKFLKTLQDTRKGTVDLVLNDENNRHSKIWHFEVNAFDDKQKYIWFFSDRIAQNDVQADNTTFLDVFKSYRNVFDLAPMGLLLLDAEGRIVAINQYFKKHVYESPQMSPGQSMYDFLDTSKSGDIQGNLQKLLKGDVVSLPIEMFFKDSEIGSVSAFVAAIGNNNSKQGLILHFFDNSSQRDLHMQIVQAQKTQAMGQLAGGIAHDFNNLLTAIIGFCDLLLARHSPSDQSFTDIMQIKQNSNRAANLVRQLLAYSKQQTLQPKVQSVVDILSDLTALLERLVGINISLDIHYGQKTGLIRVDRGQFEQVIINLVVNARDAMKGHGKLEIKTYNKSLPRKMNLGHDIVPDGKYVMIEVIDTGCGIAKENLSRIFDPFFSTKEVGQGTGLGLSTVYGIVKQTDGHISVESTEGVGTTFKLMLPFYEQVPDKQDKKIHDKRRTLEDLSGKGHILLVEDEDAVRLFASRALKDKGYEISQARDGFEALELVHQAQDKNTPFNLIISDVVMPTMDGPTLVEKAHEIFPELKVIFISGYAEDSFRQRVKGDDNIHFLSKPFSLKNLAQKVKDVLNDAKDDLNQSPKGE